MAGREMASREASKQNTQLKQKQAGISDLRKER
jgi:hypothetical protein